MGSDDQDFKDAVSYHQASEFAQAEAVCLRILRTNPNHADAWNLLGILAYQGRKPDAALAYFDRARSAAPRVSAYSDHRGQVLEELGRYAEAEQDYLAALQLDPNRAPTHCKLGNLLRKLGRLEDSIVCYRRALVLMPNLPAVHNDLGNLLFDQRRFEEAATSFRRALELVPGFPEAHNNLGSALRTLGQWEEGAACFRRALALRPDFAVAHSNLGEALRQLGHFEEAVECGSRALSLRPDYPEGLVNYGIALHELGRYEEAMASYRRALELSPELPEAHINLGQMLLARGDYSTGWTEYEWRLRSLRFGLPGFSQPFWDGSSLVGQTIVLHPEQGLGDTIHFVRYAALVKERVGTVVLRCPRRLLGILATCPGIDRLVAADAPPPPHDVHVPLLSLPRLFDTTLATIPAPIPYLSADPALAAQLGERVATLPGFKVGIVWQGNPNYVNDRQRSVPLARFEALARVPGVTLISLQKGPGVEQMARCSFPVLDWGSALDERTEPFLETAALLTGLDLVITVDTAIVHLCGALGVQAWLAQTFRPHWPWLLEGDVSPWYPSVRLFRQTRAGEWAGVFDRIAKELAVVVTSVETVQSSKSPTW